MGTVERSSKKLKSYSQVVYSGKVNNLLTMKGTFPDLFSVCIQNLRARGAAVDLWQEMRRFNDDLLALFLAFIGLTDGAGSLLVWTEI